MTGMPRLKLARCWYAMGGGLLLLVAVASLMPVPEVALGVGDKTSHFLIYGVLAGWFCLLARSLPGLLGTLLALTVFGMLVEVAQGMTGYRYAEWGDVLANSLGCLLGSLAYLPPLRRGFSRIDQALAARL